MCRCDIIIPIYNAYDCVKACVASILKCTDFSKSHLILIDDKSPDEKMVPLLREFEKKYPDKITVLFNEENLGFVGTVNKGMKWSKNDVLLLNSDTEVTKRWLEKIQKCAYSGERIATVTPLSNNATLASVPKIFERNELPNGYSLEKMGEVVEKCSMKMYPEIPTAHGFCMYIKREVIDKVGYFDEEKFGKGYGEENDFSYRCLKYGYRHLLADDTYILHKESQSFLDKKENHLDILEEMHPIVKPKVDLWCQKRDIDIIGNNVALAMGIEEKRKNILFVIHDWHDLSKNVGGTTLHALDLIENLREKYNIHVLAPEEKYYKVHSYFRDTDLITYVKKRYFDVNSVCIYSDEYNKMFNEILDKFGIDFVHVHHMIENYFDIKDVCEKKHIKYVVSLHDFYCQYPIDKKLDDRFGEKVEFQVRLDAWREICGVFLRGAAQVFAPSDYTKEIYENVYKGLKIKVIEHGVNLKKNKAAFRSGNKIKNVAFVGAISKHKGSNLLRDMADEVLNRRDVKLHLFGISSLVIPENENFIDHGKYEREELPKLLRDNKIDAVCILAISPETYAYTVEEVAAAGVPILIFDKQATGAPAERVAKHNLGWVIEQTDSPTKVLDILIDKLNDTDNYKKVIKAINNYKIKDTKTMASEYDTIYKRYLNKDDKKALDFKFMQKKLEDVELVLSDSRYTMIDANLKRELDIIAQAYDKILNSKRWKLIKKITIPRAILRVARRGRR